MAQLITLNGSTIKTPNNFQIEEYNLTKAGRTADGMMHLDFISDKTKFLLRYTNLSQNDYNTIRAKIRTPTMFFTITYKDNDVTYSKTVYVGAIHRTQYRTDTGAWYWKDVQFDLIEQ